MTDSVTIAVDTGASGIKVVGAIDGEQCVAFLMAPHCLEIDTNATEKADSFDEHRVWVKFDNEAYAVGTLAQTLGASVRMKPLKYTMATPKICAAIGVVMQKLELPFKFNLNLVCVLPASEFNDRNLVIEGVRSAIKTLEFPNGKVKIKLKEMNIFPEGFGLIQGHGRKLNEIKSVTMVMMGHRNVSTFETKFGTPCKPHTSSYGFNHFLSDVASQTGYNQEDLLELISASRYQSSLLEAHFKYKKNLEGELQLLEVAQKENKDLTDDGHNSFIKSLREQIKAVEILIEKEQNIKRSMDKNYQERYYTIIKSEGKSRDYENTKIHQVIEKAKQSYVIKITDWLDEHIPDRTNIICIGGGTSKLLWDDIYPFLIKRVAGELNPELCVLRDISISYPQYEPDAIMMKNDNRFSDIYSLFRFQLDKK